MEVGFYEQDKVKGRSVQLSADGKTAWLVMDGKVEREVSVAEAGPLSDRRPPAAGSEGGRGARPAAPSVRLTCASRTAFFV